MVSVIGESKIYRYRSLKNIGTSISGISQIEIVGIGDWISVFKKISIGFAIVQQKMFSVVAVSSTYKSCLELQKCIQKLQIVIVHIEAVHSKLLIALVHKKFLIAMMH